MFLLTTQIALHKYCLVVLNHSETISPNFIRSKNHMLAFGVLMKVHTIKYFKNIFIFID